MLMNNDKITIWSNNLVLLQFSSSFNVRVIITTVIHQLVLLPVYNVRTNTVQEILRV